MSCRVRLKMSSNPTCTNCSIPLDPFAERKQAGYRCAFCGRWFCLKDAEAHFGKPKNGE